MPPPKPEVVIHQLTDLPDALDRRRLRPRAGNARMRIEGTRNLVAAAIAAGANRLIAQSIAFAYAPGQSRAARPIRSIRAKPARDGRGRARAGTMR